MKRLRNLENEIDYLNKPSVEGGEVFESEFEFKIVEENGRHIVFDANERYHIGWAEEMRYMWVCCAEEFGFKPPVDRGDTVHEAFEAAVKRDLGKNAYLEWLDNVRMVVCEE